jgi:hemerythrin-like domain-containing protein
MSNFPFRTTGLLESTAAYISLLRHHIHTEDHVFFPMVEETMTAEEKQDLLAEFEKEKKNGEKTFEIWHKLVVDMGSILVHM